MGLDCDGCEEGKEKISKEFFIVVRVCLGLSLTNFLSHLFYLFCKVVE